MSAPGRARIGDSALPRPPQGQGKGIG